MSDYFDFTSEDLFGKEDQKNDCFLEYEDTLEDFIDKTCRAITSENNGFPVVVNMGSLILFFVFDDNPNDNPDTELVDAYLALSIFDKEFVMVPSAIGDWIISQYLDHMDNMRDILAEDADGDVPF
jgi:hypothetical protein